MNPSNSEDKVAAGSEEENNYELCSVSIQDLWIPSYTVQLEWQLAQVYKGADKEGGPLTNYALDIITLVNSHEASHGAAQISCCIQV